MSLDSEVIAEADGHLPNAFVSTSKGQKPIEFVGERKIRARQQLSSLMKISARNENVSSIGPISEVAGHLQEVDLQDNLLFQWEEVFSLGLQLPHLNCLLLHGNRMLSFTEDLSTSLSM